jgi:hypothetical protein
MKLCFESLEAREVPSVAPGGEDAPPREVLVPASVRDAVWADYPAQNAEYVIEGTWTAHGGLSKMYVGLGDPDAHPILVIADGGEIIVEPWVGANGPVGTSAVLDGVPLLIEPGGKLTLKGDPSSTALVEFVTNSYVVNFGTIRIEHTARMVITGSTETNYPEFPLAGLYSTGAVQLQAGDAPTLTTSNKLDVSAGWYQQGGSVTLYHNVPDVTGPHNRPDVVVWGDVFMRDVEFRTSGAGSVGGGGFVVTGNLTFDATAPNSLAFWVRDSFNAGEGIDTIQATTVCFTGYAPAVSVTVVGSPTNEWRHFIIGLAGDFAPVFFFEASHWEGWSTTFGGGFYGDLRYVP